MYTKLVISLLLLSHVINDFYLQDYPIGDNNQSYVKNRGGLRILFKHSVLFFLSSLVLTIFFLSVKILISIFLITLVHFTIDTLKNFFEYKYKKISNLSYLLIDQIIHFSTVTTIIAAMDSLQINSLFNNMLPKVLDIYPTLKFVTYNNLIYFTLLTTFVLFTINGGTVVTKCWFKLAEHLYKKRELFRSNCSPNQKNKRVQENAVKLQSVSSQNLKQVNVIQHEEAVIQEITATVETIRIHDNGQAKTSQKEISNETSGYKYGEVIGILERIIIFALIVTSNYEPITFVIAAKSIARFKQFSDDNFSDIYLVGTLSSSLTAIVCGMFFQQICKIFNIVQ